MTDDTDLNINPDPSQRWHIVRASDICGADEKWEATFPLYGTIRGQGKMSDEIDTLLGPVSREFLARLAGTRLWERHPDYGWRLSDKHM